MSPSRLVLFAALVISSAIVFAQAPVAPVNDRGDLVFEEFEKLLNSRTRLVSVTHVSNVLGTINPVREIVAAQPERYFYPDQYSNPANPRAHYEGTASEILEQTGGRITHFVAGLGTTGTFTGTSRRLKEHDASIRTIAVQPDDSFHGLEGLKHLPTAIVPRIWDQSLADEVWGCPTEPAYELARAIARSEGLLVGHSSGAAHGRCADSGPNPSRPAACSPAARPSASRSSNEYTPLTLPQAYTPDGSVCGRNCSAACEYARRAPA